MTSGARFILGVAFALGVTSCAGTDGAIATQQSTTAREATASGAARPSNLVIDVTIAGGVVSPANAELTAVAGEPITLVVNSDKADEIHVHSIPDHSFAVAAQQNQKFEFAATVPGRVEVELHGLDRTIAIIQVKP